MPRKSSKLSGSQLYVAIDEQLSELLPNLYSVITSESDFISLHLKLREDGSTLAIAKRHADDGHPVVIFGNGYGVSGALLAVDASIQGGNWRDDKPWKP